jgi:hypothetical protein
MMFAAEGSYEYPQMLVGRDSTDQMNFANNRMESQSVRQTIDEMQADCVLKGCGQVLLFDAPGQRSS